MLSAMLLMAACTKTNEKQAGTDTEQGDPNKMSKGGPVLEDSSMSQPVEQSAPQPAPQPPAQ
jgi:hypothetical protein